MDHDCFDQLTRLIGKGSSRRAILKGFLGLGGAVSAASIDHASARTTRSRLTTAPPPDCLLPMQWCGGDCCEPGHCLGDVCHACPADQVCGDGCCSTGLCTSAGECCEVGQQVCGSVCCPASASCAITGNQDTCCTGTPCGFDCCADPLACCDAECCASGDVCLSRVYGGGFEEVCCPMPQTCGGGCCDGTCFTPPGSGASGFDRSCCPPGGNLCPGAGDFAGTALCCGADTPDCCNAVDGSPVCLTAEQCCTADECAGLTNPAQCHVGECNDFTCQAISTCPAGEFCCQESANTCCPDGQKCCLRDDSVICLNQIQCCEDSDCFQLPTLSCDVTTNFCICTPLTCDHYAALGLCGSLLADGCLVSISCGCGEGEQCCRRPSSQNGFCRPDSACCFDEDCDPPPDDCTTVTCTEEGICEYVGCPEGLECCSRTDTCFDPQTQCCRESNCVTFGYSFECIECTEEHECVAIEEGQVCDNICQACTEGRCIARDELDHCAEETGVCCGDDCCDGLCCDYGEGFTECYSDGECCFDSDCDESQCGWCNLGTCESRCWHEDQTCCPVSNGQFDCIVEACSTHCMADDECPGEQQCCGGACCESARCCERPNGTFECIFDDLDNNNCCTHDDCNHYDNPDSCFVGLCRDNDEGIFSCSGVLACNTNTHVCCHQECVPKEGEFCCREEPCPDGQCCLYDLCWPTCLDGRTCCNDNVCRTTCD